MTVEKRGISVIVVTQASICHWLEVPNRQGNYPFTYLGRGNLDPDDCFFDRVGDRGGDRDGDQERPDRP